MSPINLKTTIQYILFHKIKLTMFTCFSSSLTRCFWISNLSSFKEKSINRMFEYNIFIGVCTCY